MYWETQPCIAYGQFESNVTDLGKAGVDRETRVKVWEQLTVGPYDVSIISGTDSNALIKWLNENEYLITNAAQSVIGFYVQKGWYFVALKISLEATSDTATALKPIKITFDSTQPIYPLKISSISSSELAEILIYVITKDHKMVASNFNTRDVDFDSLIEAILITDYETWFKEQLSQFGEPAFIVEYSDYVRYWRLYSLYEEFPQMKETEEPYFLTRFRTYISPEQMDDVVFEKNPSGDKAFSVVLNWLDGDMDKDGRLTALDGLITQRIAIGYDNPTYFHREVGDVYPEDGDITKNDVITILSRSVGLW